MKSSPPAVPLRNWSHVVPVGCTDPELQVCWWTHPVCGLHASLVQSSWSLQSGGGPPAQEPLLQASPVVQALPSLHVLPLGAVGFEQAPVGGSRVPATWH